MSKNKIGILREDKSDDSKKEYLFHEVKKDEVDQYNKILMKKKMK